MEIPAGCVAQCPGPDGGYRYADDPERARVPQYADWQERFPVALPLFLSCLLLSIFDRDSVAESVGHDRLVV